MSSSNDNMESYTDLVKRAADIQEFVDEFGEVADIVPYAKHVWAAQKFARRRRLMNFLKSLDVASYKLQEKSRKKFEKTINSKLGGEILSDYTDSVLRTSSKVATSAFAILYADSDGIEYDNDTKLLAVIALEGISDMLIDAFLEIASLAKKKPQETNKATYKEPYNVFGISGELISQEPSLRRFIPDACTASAAVNELIRRGFFVPDPAPSRFAGEDWFFIFGITEQTWKLEKLLKQAKGFLNDSL